MRIVDLSSDVCTRTITTLSRLSKHLDDDLMEEIANQLADLLCTEKCARPQSYVVINDDGSTNRPVYDTYIQGITNVIKLASRTVILSLYNKLILKLAPAFLSGPSSSAPVDVETKDNMCRGIAMTLNELLSVPDIHEAKIDLTVPPVLSKIASKCLSLLDSNVDIVRSAVAETIGPLSRALTPTDASSLLTRLIERLREECKNVQPDTSAESATRSQRCLPIVTALVNACVHLRNRLNVNEVDGAFQALLGVLQPALTKQEAHDLQQQLWADTVAGLDSIISAVPSMLSDSQASQMLVVSKVLAEYDPLLVDNSMAVDTKDETSNNVVAGDGDDDGFGDDDDDGFGEAWTVPTEDDSNSSSASSSLIALDVAAVVSKSNDSSHRVRSQASRLVLALSRVKPQVIHSDFNSLVTLYAKLLKEHDATVIADHISVIQVFIAHAASALGAPPQVYCVPPFSTQLSNWLDAEADWKANSMGDSDDETKTRTPSPTPSPTAPFLSSGISLVREPSVQSMVRPLIDSLNELLSQSTLVSSLCHLFKTNTNANTHASAHELLIAIVRATSRKGCFESQCPLSPFISQIIDALADSLTTHPSPAGARALIAILHLVPHNDTAPHFERLLALLPTLLKSNVCCDEITAAAPYLVLLLRTRLSNNSITSSDANASFVAILNAMAQFATAKDISLTFRANVVRYAVEAIALTHLPLLVECPTSSTQLTLSPDSINAMFKVASACGQLSSSTIPAIASIGLTNASTLLQHCPTLLAQKDLVPQFCSFETVCKSAHSTILSESALRLLHFLSTMSSTSIRKTQVPLATYLPDTPKPAAVHSQTLAAVRVQADSISRADLPASPSLLMATTLISMIYTSSKSPITIESPEYKVAISLLPGLFIIPIAPAAEEALERLARATILAAADPAGLAHHLGSQINKYVNESTLSTAARTIAAILLALPAADTKFTLSTCLNELNSIYGIPPSEHDMVSSSTVESTPQRTRKPRTRRTPNHTRGKSPVSKTASNTMLVDLTTMQTRNGIVRANFLLELLTRYGMSAPLPATGLEELLFTASEGGAQASDEQKGRALIDDEKCSRLLGVAALTQTTLADTIISEVTSLLDEALDNASRNHGSAGGHPQLDRQSSLADASSGIVGSGGAHVFYLRVLADWMRFGAQCGAVQASNASSAVAITASSTTRLSAHTKLSPRIIARSRDIFSLMLRHAPLRSGLRTLAASVISIFALIDPHLMLTEINQVLKRGNSNEIRVIASALESILLEVPVFLEKTVTLRDALFTPAHVSRNTLLSLLKTCIRSLSELLPSSDRTTSESALSGLNNLLDQNRGVSLLVEERAWPDILKMVMNHCVVKRDAVVPPERNPATTPYDDPFETHRILAFTILRKVLALQDNHPKLLAHPELIVQRAAEGLADFDDYHSHRVRSKATEVLLLAVAALPDTVLALANNLPGLMKPIRTHYAIVTQDTAAAESSYKNTIAELRPGQPHPPRPADSPKLASSKDVLKMMVSICLAVHRIKGSENQGAFQKFWTETVLKSKFLEEARLQILAAEAAEQAKQ